MTVEFSYAIAYVADVDATVSFYERAFGLVTRFRHESGSYSEMDTGSTVLAFAEDDFAEAGNGVSHVRSRLVDAPAGVSMTLTTGELDALWERALAAGATPIAPPVVKPWGQRVGHVRDVNGMLIELATPIG